MITPDWMREVAGRAEELGFDSLWLNEFTDTEASVRASFPDPPRYYDPLLVIADLAARTLRIRFLTATLVLPEHSPLLLARQALTLSSLTGGRLSVGVGLGGSKEEFRRLHGELHEPNRGQMMEDYLAALRVLWSGQVAEYRGTYARFQGVQVTPLPGSDRIPLLLAGAAAGAMDRLARYADGWIDSHHSPDEVRQMCRLPERSDQGGGPVRAHRRVPPVQYEPGGLSRGSRSPGRCVTAWLGRVARLVRRHRQAPHRHAGDRRCPAA